MTGDLFKNFGLNIAKSMDNSKIINDHENEQSWLDISQQVIDTPKSYITLDKMQDYSEFFSKGKITNQFDDIDKDYKEFSHMLGLISDSVSMLLGSKGVTAIGRVGQMTKFGRALTRAYFATLGLQGAQSIYDSMTNEELSDNDKLFSALAGSLAIVLGGSGALGKTFKTANPKKIIQESNKFLKNAHKIAKFPKIKKGLKDYANSSTTLSSATLLLQLLKLLMKLV